VAWFSAALMRISIADVFGPPLFTDFRGQCQTVRLRHLQIDQRHIEVRAGEQRTGLSRGPNRTARVPQPARHLDERISHIGQVIHDQHTERFAALEEVGFRRNALHLHGRDAHGERGALPFRVRGIAGLDFKAAAQLLQNVPDHEEADPGAVATRRERHSCASQSLQRSKRQTWPSVMHDKADHSVHR
jgi:hypothetical protein